MASLTLFNAFGQVLSTHVDLGSAVATGITNVIGNVNYTQVVAQGQTTQGENAPVVEEVGFAEDTALAQLTDSTVQIPQNFAGLESVMVPTRLRNQLFEITEVHEMDGYVEITAVHIFYQQRQNYTLWEPNENTNYSGASAIRNVMTNALFDMKFKVASDSTDMIRGNELDFARKNIVEAFLNPESGICARYGLSMIRDNDTFYCLKDVGYDRGFVVESRKNMLGVERTESIEEIVTRVAPVGHDADGNLVWMNRNGKKYIDSPHINEYAKPKAEIYMTNLEIGRDGVTAENIQQKLYEEAKKRFDEDEADIPTVSMTVQFIGLGDTEEYKQYRDLDKVYLFDVIHIKDTERGYSYGAQVIAVQHNILTGLLESVTIGTPQPWDGVRKIGAWQVPEITGGKIRHGSIRTSELADSSVTSDKLADGSVNASHMSQSADAHFENIFAEQLYISNTSEDGLLHTRFDVTEGLISAEVTRATGAESSISGALTVEAGKVAMVVGTNSGGNFIKAAEIATSINEAGEGVATIDADKIMIGNEKSTTVINGKIDANDITANFIQGKINQLAVLHAGSISSGSVTVEGTVNGDTVEAGNVICDSLNGNDADDIIVNASVNTTTNTLTLTKASGGTVTFSKAASVSLSGAWSGNNFVVSASDGSVTPITESFSTSKGTGEGAGGGLVTLDSFASHKAYAYVKSTRVGGGNGVLFRIVADATSEYNQGSTDGYASAHLSGSWGTGANANKFTATKVNTGSSDSLVVTVTAGIEYNTTTHKYTAQAKGNQAVKATAESGTEAYDAGAATVTLSQGSWSEGALVVTASNGKKTTVSMPTGTSEWVNTEDNKWRVKYTIGGTTRNSSVKNFQSLYDAGYKAGWNACVDKITEDQWYPTYTTYWNAPSGGTALSGYWLRSSQYFNVGTIPAKK